MTLGILLKMMMELNDGISDFSGGFWSRLLLEHVLVGLGNVVDVRDRRVPMDCSQQAMMQACILCRFS